MFHEHKFCHDFALPNLPVAPPKHFWRWYAQNVSDLAKWTSELWSPEIQDRATLTNSRVGRVSHLQL
jgi:hypothetical protein